jgi:P27 family predicted phage terminase small subunit
MLTTSRPKPSSAPKSLQPQERELWDRITKSFEVSDPASETLLLQALQARGRARQAHERLERDGLTVIDKRGDVKAHPAIQIERFSQQAFCAAMRLLRLDLNPD